MNLTAMKINSKEVGNINFSGRVKQIILLFIVILIGIIISITTAEAKNISHDHTKKHKSIHRKHISMLAHACHLNKGKQFKTGRRMTKHH